MAPAIFRIAGVPLSEPITWRAKKKATTSDSTLTPRKKYIQY
jgi:hypothetical protein